jgi:hypothetical protein
MSRPRCRSCFRTGCPADEYTLEADAYHAGDRGAGRVSGAGACPGVSDGKVDTNTDDDAPRSKFVTVGTP